MTSFRPGYNNNQQQQQQEEHSDDEKIESPVTLPAKITSVQVQKKHKDRYSLFADDQFLIGISEDTLIESNLKKGDAVDEGTFENLIKTEYKSKLRFWLIDRLASRDHSRAELYRKAVQKGYDKNLTNALLDQLESADYLSDERFTKAFVRDKHKLNKWGPRKIQAALQQKGITSDVAKKELDNQLDKQDLYKQAKTLLQKKRNRYEREPDFMKRKQKMMRFLAGRGFSGDVFFNAVDDELEAWK